MAADDAITQAQNEAICKAIEFVTADIDSYGLSGVNFDNLQIATAIPAYEYKNGKFIKIREYYPIIDGEHIVATATNVCNDKYAIETWLAKSIDRVGYNDVALIYDSQGVYLYNGYDTVLLGYSGIFVSERDTINLSSEDVTFSEVATVNITKSTPLGYTESRNQSGPPYYYSCGVSYVPQFPYSNLCWAATTACIKNYLSGTSLTAGDVSMAYFESSYVYDIGLPTSSIASFMQSHYSMSYTYGSYVPSNSVLVNNISNGYPVFGSFLNSSNRHAVTIYGVNAVMGYISLMNPTFGVETGIFNGTTYVFVSSSSGNSFSLDEAICHNW